MGEAEREGLDGVDLVVLAVALAGGLERGRRGRLVRGRRLDGVRLGEVDGALMTPNLPSLKLSWTCWMRVAWQRPAVKFSWRRAVALMVEVMVRERVLVEQNENVLWMNLRFSN